MRRTVLLSAVSALALCTAAAADRFPGKQWLAYATPDDAGFSAAKLAEAEKYWKSLPSAALFAVYDGAVVVAWGDVERRFMLHSAHAGPSSLCFLASNRSSCRSCASAVGATARGACHGSFR